MGSHSPDILCNYTSVILLGVVYFTGGVESGLHLITKNDSHERIYDTSSARQRMVFHPQRHSAWRASWTGARALQNNDGSIHHCYKGTVRQAVMLGVAATLSHTAVVWLIAFGGMYISNKFTAESAEPRLQMVSSVIILGTAFGCSGELER